MPSSKKSQQKKLDSIIILGPSGSGKGTQAELLARKFGFEIVDGGQYLRKLIKGKTVLARKTRKISHGRLAPTKVIKQWLKEQITVRCKKGFIISGQPRMIGEAKFALKCFRQNKCNLPLVIFLRVSDKEIYKRLGKRYLREKRADDTRDGIKNRLTYFKKQVRKTLAYFKKEKILIEINGEQSIENVFKDILKAINND